MSNEYNEFVARLSEAGISVDDNNLTMEEKLLVNKVLGNTQAFIVTHNLATGSSVAAIEDFGTPLVARNEKIKLANIGVEHILDLCRSCDIRTDHLPTAVRTVAFAIANKNAQSFGHHFNTQSVAQEGMDTVSLRRLDTVIGARAIDSIMSTQVGVTEAFGQDVDKLTTDLKLVIAINIMKFHKNILDRMINRKPVSGNVVQFQVPHAEVYDLEKSQSLSSADRNFGSHRIPLIDLYKDPSPANMAAKQIIPLVSNDTNGVLVADSIIKMGVEVNLFDLSLDASRIGYSHYDYTDLVSEGVMLDKLYITISKDNGTDPATVEIIPITVKGRSSGRYNMRNNSRDSADRNCVLSESIILNSATLTDAGTASTILAPFTGASFIRGKLKASGEINLKTSDGFCNGSITAEATTDDESDLPAALATLFSSLTFTVPSYSLDARYSEENMRKTTSAVRMHTRPMAYEIPVGKNVIVDYSLAQVQPQNVLDVVAQHIAIGNDYRGITVIEDTINMVFDRLASEKQVGIFEDHRDRIGYDFVAGMQVLPYVYKNTLDLDSIVLTIQSGRTLGDVRGAVEKYMIEMFARIYTESMYPNVLDTGEVPYFRVLTSGPLLAALFNVPHYHDHLNKTYPNGEGIEYTRVLPDGTVLEIITTTWNSFADKILFIPYRPKQPESELAFAQNCDRGTFVAHFSPTQYAATHKRIATNSREIPIPTNPVAALLTVTKVTELFDGLQGLGV